MSELCIKEIGNLNRQANCCPLPRTVQEHGFTPVMAYVPIQELTTVYEPYQGFSKGTIFPDLDKPFLKGWCMR